MSQYDKLWEKVHEAEENRISAFSFVDDEGEEVVVRIVQIDPRRFGG